MQSEKIQIFVEKLSRPVARGGGTGARPPFLHLKRRTGGGHTIRDKKGENEKMKKEFLQKMKENLFGIFFYPVL